MSHPPSERRLLTLLTGRFADLAPGDLVLLALSGGGDSTALAHLMVRANTRLRLRLEALHLDHALGRHARGLARFVEDLCRRLELPCRFERVDVAELSRRRKLGIEEAGRFARRELFLRVAAERKAAAVVLGHTRDDRAETLLYNLVRGAGPGGLSSMRETSLGILRRPLLGVGREQLRDYLEEIHQVCFEDPTNRDLRFSRNLVRHRVLPLLERLNPRAVEALARAAELLADDEDYLASVARGHLPGPMALDASVIDAASLAALPPALARRAAITWLGAALGGTHDLTHEHVDAVLTLAHSLRAPRATDLPRGGRLERRRGSIVLTTRLEYEEAPVPGAVALAVPGVTRVPWAGLSLRATPLVGSAPAAKGTCVALPAARLERAVVRPAARGDRFRPLGAPGAKALSRYLMDRKVPREQRARVPVVAGDAGILWVIGHQVSEAARGKSSGAGEPMVLLEARETS